MSTFTAKLRSCRLRKEWRVDIKKVCQCIHRRQAHNTHNHTHTTHTDIPRHTGIQHTGRQTHKVCNLQQHTSTHMHTALLGVCQFCGVSGRTSPLLSPFNQENFDISNHTQGKDWMRIKMETITTNNKQNNATKTKTNTKEGSRQVSLCWTLPSSGHYLLLARHTAHSCRLVPVLFVWFSPPFCKKPQRYDGVISSPP